MWGMVTQIMILKLRKCLSCWLQEEGSRHRLLTHPKLVSNNKVTGQIEKPSEFSLIYPAGFFFLQTLDTFSVKKRTKLNILDIYLYISLMAINL